MMSCYFNWPVFQPDMTHSYMLNLCVAFFPKLALKNSINKVFVTSYQQLKNSGTQAKVAFYKNVSKSVAYCKVLLNNIWYGYIWLKYICLEDQSTICQKSICEQLHLKSLFSDLL